MNKMISAVLLAASVVLPAHAVLKAGDKAPSFTMQASFAGKEFTYSLAEALKKGPVIAYFYPAAFTSGCTIEAHAFAEAVEQYRALGATVVGISNDKIETLNKFSVTDCSGKFAVAADTDQKVMKSYDSVLMLKSNYANRVSYVISPSSEVIYAYDSLDPTLHVENTMKALQKWVAANKAR